MKRILIAWLLLTIISLCSTGQVESPYEKGNVNIGGNISFQSDKFKDIHPSVDYLHKIKNLDLNLSLGFFVIDQLSAGIKIDYLINDTEYKEQIIPQHYSAKNLLIGPEIKYFFKTGIFCEASSLFGFSSSGPQGDHQDKWINYSYSTGIGYSILLNRCVAIEPIIKYRYLRKKANENVENDIVISGMIFSCGLHVYLDFKRNKQKNFSK